MLSKLVSSLTCSDLQMLNTSLLVAVSTRHTPFDGKGCLGYDACIPRIVPIDGTMQPKPRKTIADKNNIRIKGCLNGRGLLRQDRTSLGC